MLKNPIQTLSLSKSTAALLSITGGAFLISFSSVFVETANVPPTVSAFYRVLFGGTVLAGIVWMRGDALWPGWKRAGWPLLCAFLFAADLFVWHRSVLIVGPGLATLLGNCQVFFVALFAFLFLRERPGLLRAISIPLAMLGLWLILGVGWEGETDRFKLGVGFGLLTAVAYAFYILSLRQAQSSEDAFTHTQMLAWISLLCAVMLGTAGLFEPESSFAIPDLQSWGSLLGMGILGQVFGWVLISRGLPGVDASLAGLALLLQPALAFVWDVLFFGRQVSGIEYAGIAITLAAIWLGTMKRKDR